MARLSTALQRRSGLANRLFTTAEQRMLDGADEIDRAKCFAVKEAVMKALGVGLDSVAFTDIEVNLVESSGLAGPSVKLHGRAATLAESLLVSRWSVTVDVLDGPTGAVALAEVVASATGARVC
jgi:phosphopantetheine--protein transferase-like protein